MTSFLSYSIDSFKKRKEFRHLFYSQISIAFLAYFITIISNSLVFSLFFSDFLALINTSIANYWGAFFILVSIFAIFLSLTLSLFIIRLIYFYQTKEMAVMIGIGGLIETIQNFFLVQLLLMCIISNILGIIIAYIGSFLTLLILKLFFSSILLNTYILFPDFQVILVFTILFFFTYMISARLILNTSKRYQDSLISDEIDFNQGKDTNLLASIFVFGKRINGSLKVTTRIVRLNIMRKSFLFILSLLTTILYSFLLVSIIFGSIVISDSLGYAMEQGTGGENTFIVVQESQTDFFRKSFDLYSDNVPVQVDFNYSQSLFDINSFSTIINRQKKPDDLRIDDRLILYKEFYGTNPSEQIQGVNSLNSGSIKRNSGFLIGIKNPIPNWQYYGQDPGMIKQNSNNVLIGEKLAWNLFNSPLNGRLFLSDKTTTQFSVSSLLIDPFLGGNTVYMNLNYLISFYNLDVSYRNVILLNSADMDYINLLKDQLSRDNSKLTIIDIKDSLSKNDKSNRLFNLILIGFSIPLILTYVILTNSYSKQLISSRIKQLRILKTLGCNYNDFKEIISKEIIAYSFWGHLIGFLFGFIFIIQGVVPFPIISLQSILITVAFILIPWFITHKFVMIYVKKLYNEYINP